MNRSAGHKPLDVGSGRICASFDLDSAAWLSVGMPHPDHGFVELSAVPPFNEKQRGDADATRQYRSAMTNPRHAVIRVELAGASVALEADVSDPTRPRWTGPGVKVVADAPLGGDVLRQTWSTQGGGAELREVVIRVRGRLDRPALAEITEINPPPPTGAVTTLTIEADRIRVEAAALPARLDIVVSGSPVTWNASGDEVVGHVAVGDGTRLGIEVRSGERTVPSGRSASAAGDRLQRRAIAYIRGCTAQRTADDEVAILTDHRILPLSWTRDAYWQALALLATGEPGDQERVAGHLRWLWRRCERPDGRWVRSHHANGQRKDLAFQADQQLYPIIELTDFWRFTGRLPDGVAWPRELPVAWDAALAMLDAETGLLASTENAADDLAAAPYLAASQILLWYAATRLAEMIDAGGLTLDADVVRGTAASARGAFSRWFARGGGPWPSAVDGQGRRVAYHDANDLPIALAPLWGFCASDDPGWRATMAFAFSPRNPAFFDGDRGGLGSAHTPGPWTLGDVQAWIAGRSAGDAATCAEALERLQAVAFVDGMLPEAYSASTEPDVRVRHWFAWPGAALAALRALDRDGTLERRLAAVPSPRIGR